MKKLVMVCTLAAASTVLFAGCGCCESNVEVDNNVTEYRKKDNTMTRTRTASGLEYEVLEEGTGPTPKRGQIVTVHYTGWLDKNGEKGTKFDSSVDRGTPFEFILGVGQVIRGWDEGVALMKVGGKYRLHIPANLGYGPRGAGHLIPGNATLIFDVELLKAS